MKKLFTYLIMYSYVGLIGWIGLLLFGPIITSLDTQSSYTNSSEEALSFSYSSALPDTVVYAQTGSMTGTVELYYYTYLPLIITTHFDPNSQALWEDGFETITKAPAPNCHYSVTHYVAQTDRFLPFSKPDPGITCSPGGMPGVPPANGACPFFGYVEAGNGDSCSTHTQISLKSNATQAQSGNQYLELNVNIGGNTSGEEANLARRIELRKDGWREGSHGTWNIGGDEIWRSAWFYLPTNFELDSWIELTDIVERKSGGWYEKYNQIQINSSGYLIIGQLFNGHQLNRKSSSQKVPRGQWVHLQEHFVRKSGNSGYVEVFIDGKLWLSNYNIRTMSNPNTAERGTELSFKLYTDKQTSRKTVYWDNIVLAQFEVPRDYVAQSGGTMGGY